MAEHELNIKATLDTSSVQRELDQINNRISNMGVAGQTGGTNVSIVKQLQTSIDALNRTLSKIELNAKHAEARMQSAPMMASRIGMGGGIPDASVVPYMGSWNGFGEWIKANRLSRPTKMGLHFGAVQLGNLSEQMIQSDNWLGGSIAGFGAGALQGASVGSLLGPHGAAIGALFGGLQSAAKQLKDVFEELAVTAAKLNKEDEEVGGTILQRKQRNKWKDLADEENLDELERQREQLEKRMNEAYKTQESLSNSAAKELNNYRATFIGTLSDKFGFGDDTTDFLNNIMASSQYGVAARILGMADDGQGVESLKRARELTRQAKESGESGKTLEAELEILKKTIADLIKEQAAEVKEAGDIAEREYDDLVGWLKQRRDMFVKLGDLEEQRKNLLNTMESEYQQKGVDILSTMGKSGKYMSTMEQSSLTQERFSQVTKKLDNMSKYLAHLQKIDSKMDKIKTGLQ